MSFVLKAFNRDSFDHLNRSVYDFWTTFALSVVSGLLVSDFLSAYLDQFGPLIKAVGTIICAAAIAIPGPVIIGATIWEGKDQHFHKALLDFPLHPGGLLIDFVEEGMIDLVTSEKDVPKDPNTQQSTGEAKVPKDPALLEHVIETKAAGWHSFAVHVVVPQRWLPGKTVVKLFGIVFLAGGGLALATIFYTGIVMLAIAGVIELAGVAMKKGEPPYQPIDDIVFDSPVPSKEAIVPEQGSGIYKGVSMKKIGHQAVIGAFYVRSLSYTVGAKPVPIFRITFCRGESLRQLKGGKQLTMTAEELGKIENAYSTIGSVTVQMDNNRLQRENDELKQQAQYDNWDHHEKAARAWENERNAFGSEPLRKSTWKWLQTRNGLIGLFIVCAFIAFILYEVSAAIAAGPHH